MRLLPFDYFEPKSVSEAIDLLSDQRGSLAKAGGTDLIPRLKWKLAKPKSLVNLKGLSELDFIRVDSRGNLRIGALTPLRDIESSSLVHKCFPALRDAVAHIGSVEIRNVATLGGNLCLDTRCEFYNQSPLFRKAAAPCLKLGGSLCYISAKGHRCHALFCADTAPLLIASGATVKVLSATGEKAILLEEFYTGDGKRPFVLSADQLVVEIQIPKLSRHCRATYVKYRYREAIDFPVVGVAVLVANDGGKIQPEKVRITVSGAVSRPFRCSRSEMVLKKGMIDGKTLEEAGKTAAEEIQIISHSGCSVSHRRTVIKELVIRGFQTVLG